MTISKELMLAILSMDSYNQGYGKGLNHGKTQIGLATKNDAPETIDIDEWQDAGFYAVSYQWGGETVISYRGTDDPLGSSLNSQNSLQSQYQAQKAA